MNLLHPEVEITPGRRGKQAYQDRDKMAGSAVLRLVNETTQENAFTVRLRCDNPFWQEGWYTVQSVAAPANAAAPASSQADIPGHNKRSVKVFVPPKGTRDILIRFDVPERPESRAGRYDYFIEVETQVTRPQEGTARRKDRLTTIPAAANVRPFYKWSLDLTPEQQRVTRRRRAGDFEVVVTNEGNDWLYCDLQLPRPKDLLLECPTLRLAVPAAGAGRDAARRGHPGGNPRYAARGPPTGDHAAEDLSRGPDSPAADGVRRARGCALAAPGCRGRLLEPRVGGGVGHQPARSEARAR